MNDSAEAQSKLLFLIPSLAGGGAERVAATLAPILARHFHLTMALLEDRRSYALSDDIRVRNFSGSLKGPAAHLVRIPFHVWSLVRLVRREKIPLVLSSLEQANILNVLAASVTGHSAIVTQHSSPREQYRGKGLLGRLIRRASRKLYPRAAHVIAVSEGVKDVLVSDYHLDDRRVTVIPNPVNLESLSSQARSEPGVSLPPQFLLHVGRLNLAAKAQDVLLAAFAIVRKRVPELALVLAGEGPDREKIEGLIRKYGLETAVRLVGWQSNVAALMTRAQAFVLPSRYEGWPMVLVEAMACGCPVVAADCSTGPREILGDSEFGLLVPAEDPEALANAILRLIENPALAFAYREKARQRVRSYSADLIGSRYISVFKGLAGQ